MVGSDLDGPDPRPPKALWGWKATRSLSCGHCVEASPSDHHGTCSPPVTVRRRGHHHVSCGCGPTRTAVCSHSEGVAVRAPDAHGPGTGHRAAGLSLVDETPQCDPRKAACPAQMPPGRAFQSRTEPCRACQAGPSRSAQVLSKDKLKKPVLSPSWELHGMTRYLLGWDYFKALFQSQSWRKR